MTEQVNQLDLLATIAGDGQKRGGRDRRRGGV